MARELITVQVADKSALAALEKIRLAGINPRPMLLEIGEDLMSSTKVRFSTSTAPDGSTWAANSPVTVSRYTLLRSGKDGKMVARSGMLTKKGGLSAKGNLRLSSKKPLIGQSKMLSHTIDYQVRQAMLLVGSPIVYASTHQFGAEAGSFGTTKRGGPIPWGDIPARPFLGLSAADTSAILQTAAKHLARI